MTIKNAVILSAGKGSRLYPHTEDKPKCLLELSGRTLLEWQLDALHASGVERMTIVTGFHHALVEQVVARRGAVRGNVQTLFNPFYQVADNTGSVWLARQHFAGDALLLNGDTLVSPALLETVQNGGTAPITITVDRKASYDADDMKVLRDGDRLLRIGKAITDYNAELIGLLAFRGAGGPIFAEKVQEVMSTDEGVRVWYLSVIDALAPAGAVGTCLIEGYDWQEVDYPSDLDAARALTAKWAGEGW